MKRWVGLVLLLVALLLVVWAGYQGYARLRALEGRVVALETRVQAQEEALKAVAERVGRLEGEVFKSPAPPLSLPEVPPPAGAPAWPYAVGVAVVAVLLFLLLRLLKGNREREGKGVQETSSEENLEVSRMEDEGAPPPRREGQ
ncbi:MAG: hypothetical protein ACK4HT_03365 [Thermus caldifontis]